MIGLAGEPEQHCPVVGSGINVEVFPQELLVEIPMEDLASWVGYRYVRTKLLDDVDGIILPVGCAVYGSGQVDHGPNIDGNDGRRRENLHASRMACFAELVKSIVTSGLWHKTTVRARRRLGGNVPWSTSCSRDIFPSMSNVKIGDGPGAEELREAMSPWSMSDRLAFKVRPYYSNEPWHPVEVTLHTVTRENFPGESKDGSSWFIAGTIVKGMKAEKKFFGYYHTARRDGYVKVKDGIDEYEDWPTLQDRPETLAGPRCMCRHHRR